MPTSASARSESLVALPDPYSDLVGHSSTPSLGLRCGYAYENVPRRIGRHRAEASRAVGPTPCSSFTGAGVAQIHAD